MSINEHLQGHGLQPLPMAAWLKQRDTAAATPLSARWELEYEWQSAKIQEPHVCTLGLYLIDFDGLQCIAMVGGAVTAFGGDEVMDDEVRALVFLLNPADAKVWMAISNWKEVGQIRLRSETGCNSAAMGPTELAVYNASSIEGNLFESDLLAAELLKLLEGKQLERVLAEKLDIQAPLYCTIVDTPAMCKSLKPLSAEEQADAQAYVAHKRRLENAHE